jgi:hypothetical protein
MEFKPEISQEYAAELKAGWADAISRTLTGK